MEPEVYLTTFYVILYKLTSFTYSLESSNNLFRCSITHPRIQVGSLVGLTNGPVDIVAAIVVDLDSSIVFLQERFEEVIASFALHHLPTLYQLFYHIVEPIRLGLPVMAENVEESVSLVYDEIEDRWNPCSINDGFLALSRSNDEELSIDEGDYLDLTSDEDDSEEEIDEGYFDEDYFEEEVEQQQEAQEQREQEGVRVIIEKIDHDWNFWSNPQYFPRNFTLEEDQNFEVIECLPENNDKEENVEEVEEEQVEDDLIQWNSFSDYSNSNIEEPKVDENNSIDKDETVLSRKRSFNCEEGILQICKKMRV